MPEFIPGLELSHLFYKEAVEPILKSLYPDLVHSAALIGPGSEVLGFDTAMSADHDWGAQVMIFLSDKDYARLADQLRQTLGYRLPFTVRGYPTHFEVLPDEPDTVVPRLTDQRPINHRVSLTVLDRFIEWYTGVDLHQELTVLDWLTIPEQNLRSLVAGAVYHDSLNVLEPMRRKFAYYPHAVWLYLLSAQWQRIGQEEPFVGRAGFVGDDVGSAVIAARLVRDLMRLCMLMERQYAPYPKWFGSAFAQLTCADRLMPLLQSTLTSTTWQDREQHLTGIYEIVTTMHNQLGITAPVPTMASRFYDRPFRVIQGETIAQRIWDAIQDTEVKRLPFGVGKVDQFVDSTDVLSHTARCRRLIALYS